MIRLILFCLLAFFYSATFSQSRTITVHLRGVAESNIAILPMSGPHAFKAISVQKNVQGGTTTTLGIPEDYLPGEFVVRFDYKEKPDGSPYPAERQLLVASEDIQLWVQPLFSGNPDSTYWQKGEKENTTYTRFLTENKERRKMINALQEFILAYDNQKAKVYKAAAKEYETRRVAYNKWVRTQMKANEGLYASSIMMFELIPKVSFIGDERTRKAALRKNYFSEMDFSKPHIVRSAQMKRWMDNYVNLHGELITRQELTDSVFTAAGISAIEFAKKGDPLVYGWMVDYFFRGFESFGLAGGMIMLAPYLNDPNCLTERRQAITKRLKGMETLVPGAEAPDFVYTDSEGKTRRFHNLGGETPYKLVLFWSASCGHCKELVGKLYPWSRQGSRPSKLQVYALSVDEADNEILEWNTAREKYTGWEHILTNGGVNSPQANDYFILSTPVMVLVRASDNSILGVPKDLQELERLMD